MANFAQKSIYFFGNPIITLSFCKILRRLSHFFLEVKIRKLCTICCTQVHVIVVFWKKGNADKERDGIFNFALFFFESTISNGNAPFESFSYANIRASDISRFSSKPLLEWLEFSAFLLCGLILRFSSSRWVNEFAKCRTQFVVSVVSSICQSSVIAIRSFHRESLCSLDIRAWEAVIREWKRMIFPIEAWNVIFIVNENVTVIRRFECRSWFWEHFRAIAWEGDVRVRYTSIFQRKFAPRRARGVLSHFDLLSSIFCPRFSLGPYLGAF